MKEIKEVARQKIGEYLKSLREEKGISTYQMTKSHGIRFEAIQAIEEGSSNYTIMVRNSISGKNKSGKSISFLGLSTKETWDLIVTAMGEDPNTYTIKAN
jgi:transcriptional regulator with XRE-family HTH domain